MVGRHSDAGCDGYLYFVGRRDEMIKTSGYRVSPTEVEEVIYATGLVAEVAALGVAHSARTGSSAGGVCARANADLSAELLAACQAQLPTFMQPARIIVHAEPLPRNPNGKIDRKRLALELTDLF
ncbi:AMP-binding enzyme [Chromatium okenii]|uniref:AMP-binding enzyme n=1 Tax=Chromatium okenii TaxID=61644 RepID=UPI003D6BDE40